MKVQRPHIGTRALQPVETEELQRRKEKEPGRLAERAPAEETRFPTARQIGVIIVIAEMRMMLHVIAAKSHRGRHRVRQIGEDRHPFIRACCRGKRNYASRRE